MSAFVMSFFHVKIMGFVLFNRTRGKIPPSVPRSGREVRLAPKGKGLVIPPTWQLSLEQ